MKLPLYYQTLSESNTYSQLFKYYIIWHSISGFTYFCKIITPFIVLSFKGGYQNGCLQYLRVIAYMTFFYTFKNRLKAEAKNERQN